jgi:hypothetical protein
MVIVLGSTTLRVVIALGTTTLRVVILWFVR